MTGFVLAAAAAADLKRIARYTREQWGRAHAHAYIDALMARFDLIARNPAMGPLRPDILPGVRCFPAESHVAYYRVAGDGIEVIRILHKRQDPLRNLASGQE